MVKKRNMLELNRICDDFYISVLKECQRIIFFKKGFNKKHYFKKRNLFWTCCDESVEMVVGRCPDPVVVVLLVVVLVLVVVYSRC